MDKESKPFELGRQISALHRHGRAYFDQRMSAFELGSGQHTFLFFLYSHNGASQDEISRALQLDKATTARAIHKLEEKGFVRREDGEKDKRVNHVFLTEKAYDIQKELRSYSDEWKAVLVNELDEQDLIILEKLINKLSTNASTYREAHCKKGGHHVK
jgi:DNA-binding MarR family transcriptional regulator